MNTLYKLACLSFALGFYVGCSPVKFGVDDGRCEKVGQNCVVQNGIYHFDNSVEVGGGKVDILIVDDNSASMSFEQKNLANRFTGFVDNLENANADYRIGIVTTDISTNETGIAGNPPRAINGYGAFQDGNLISFGSGIPFLTPTVAGTQAGRVSLFNNAIVRSETAQCEKFVADWVQTKGVPNNNATYNQQYPVNCPSGDERGIYAANLAVKKNPSNFFRTEANLAVIFLSDEDERSGLYTSGGYALAPEDQPNTLIANIRSKYGSGKNIKVHSIVVKDNACLNSQSTQKLNNSSNVPVAATAGLVTGSKGNAYLTFTTNGWGQSVDICSLGYTTSLGSISTSIIDQINSVAVACENPTDLHVVVSGGDNSITWTVDGKNVRFNKLLPAGTTVRLTYDCASI